MAISNKGADVYSFGNGTLGQLGIGIEGSSKGRLLPTLIEGLHDIYPMGIIDIAAGGNFTVAVTVDGSVYSFGHSEYNQHGTSGDHIDPSYFFLPRKLNIKLNRSTTDDLFNREEECIGSEDAHIVKVSCGFNYTVGITKSGRTFSWGWNESGVLGHGSRHFTNEVKEIEGFKRFGGGQVQSISTGSKHVLAIITCESNKWASTYKYLLEDIRYADVELIFGNMEGKSIKCHSAILAARSPYFYGYLKQVREDYSHAVTTGLTSDNSEASFTDSSTIQSITAIAHKVHLSSNYADDITVKSLIEYIYLDRINIPHHKKRYLLGLANDLCMEGLCARICNLEKLSEEKFTVDMNVAIDDITFADVVFTQDPFHNFKDEGYKHDTDIHHPPVLYAHKAILSRIPYFEAIFNGEYKESSEISLIPSSKKGSMNRFISSIDITGFISDGLDVEIFKMLVQYAYIGQTTSFPQSYKFQNKLSPSCIMSSTIRYNMIKKDRHESLEKDLRLSGEDLMGLLVAANMMSYTKLAQHCERQLSVHIADYPENTKNLLDFAQAYNFKHLEDQCLQLMEI